MRPILLLIHGWGLDASFWAPLQAALGEVESIAWDLGFFGRPACPPLPEGRPVVAVGHSFGLLWLLRRRSVAWHTLVSINGFRRFTADDSFPAGVAPRLLDRMIARFATAPEAVYGDFMARCGVPAAPVEGVQQAELADGLQALRDWDERGQAVDFALAGRSDPIVSPAMTALDLAGVAVEWHEGGHLLPRQAPEWCAASLRRICEKDRNEGD